jgi:hypothetical protein
MAKEGFDSPHWNRCEPRVTTPHGNTRITGWQVCAAVVLALFWVAPAAFSTLSEAVPSAATAATRG